MSSTAIRVLVLDDEKSVRSNLRAFFEDEGFEALLCSSGEEALDLMSRFQVDVAVVDIRLPGMNGHEFMLKAHEVQPGLKFLVYTGSPDYDLPAALVESGIVPLVRDSSTSRSTT